MKVSELVNILPTAIGPFCVFCAGVLAIMGSFWWQKHIEVERDKQITPTASAPGTSAQEKILSSSQVIDAKNRFRKIPQRPVSVFYTTPTSIKQAEQIRSLFLELGWPDVAPINSVMSSHVQGVVVTGYNYYPPEIRGAIDAITIPFGPIDDARIEYLNRAAKTTHDGITFIVGNL